MWTLQSRAHYERLQGNSSVNGPKGPKKGNDRQHRPLPQEERGKTENAYQCEARVLTGKRITETQNKDHEAHIAKTGCNSMSHHNLVHKFSLMRPAVKTPDAKAAVDRVQQAKDQK